MSNASKTDGVTPVGASGSAVPQSPITARRRALKAMLGAAPVVLTFPSVTAAAASVTCQTVLRTATRPATIVASQDPSWFRVVVKLQTYKHGNNQLPVYAYDASNTTKFYRTSFPYERIWDSGPPNGWQHVGTDQTKYVLADLSKNPVEPDFTAAGTASTLSCMASVTAG